MITAQFVRFSVGFIQQAKHKTNSISNMCRVYLLTTSNSEILRLKHAKKKEKKEDEIIQIIRHEIY